MAKKEKIVFGKLNLMRNDLLPKKKKNTNWFCWWWT